jgi:hypothetical protein
MDRFLAWFAEQPARHRVLTCGNHEYRSRPIPTNGDAVSETPRCCSTNRSRSRESKSSGAQSPPFIRVPLGSSEVERGSLWRTIAVDTDVLITHGGPEGILSGDGGCPALRRAVTRVKLRLRCFGHVHSAYGLLPTKNTLFVNAAILDEEGAPSRKPVLLSLSK